MTELTVGPLVALVAALGLDRTQLVTAETTTVLDLNHAVEFSVVRGLDFEAVQTLAEAYGDALRAKIAEGRLSVRLSGAVARDTFEQQREFFDPEAPHELQIHVDKRLLVERVLGPDRAGATTFWFFAASAARAVADLEAFGRDVWGEHINEGRLVLIGDSDPHLTGPLLTVTGSANPPGPPVPDQQVLDLVARMRAGAEDSESDTRLTPEHLLFDKNDKNDKDTGTTTVEQSFAGAYIQLFLRYTANRVRRTASGDFRAEYRGGGGTRVVVVLPATPPKNAGVASGELQKVLEWCYQGSESSAEDWTANRMRFSQVEVAHRLEMVPEAGRLAVLLDTAKSLWQSLEDEYRAFIEGRITAYFEQQRDFEDLVRNVVQKFGEQATTLTKNLSEVMLGAVATLIASAIAAAFKDPFNAALFRVGVLTYTAYLVLVPGLYGISAQRGQFEALDLAFDRDLIRFEGVLGKQKVNDLKAEEQEKAARDRYRFWLRMTIAGFAAAAVVASALAWFVPMILTR